MDEVLVVLTLFVGASGCRVMPQAEPGAPGTLEVRIHGLSPQVDAVELLAGMRKERVAISQPTPSMTVFVPEVSSGRTTVEVRGMWGAIMLQRLRVDAVVRGGLLSVVSMDLGFPPTDSEPDRPDGGMHIETDGSTTPGLSDAGDTGGEVVASEPIILKLDGSGDFSFTAPGVLRGVTAGDPNGVYRDFLRRAAAILTEPFSGVVGIVSVDMRLREEGDDLELNQIFADFRVQLEGPRTGTSTLARPLTDRGGSGWFSLDPEPDLSLSQADLLTGDFDVSIQGSSPLQVPTFDGQIDVRMVYEARSR